MRRLAGISLIALLCISAIAAAVPQTDAKTDAKTVSGTISRVDTTGKMLIVKQASGDEVTVYWNERTAVSGDLREGQPVRVEVKEQDGKTWATSIQVQAKKPY
jgi:cold shock CspA family protein